MVSLHGSPTFAFGVMLARARRITLALWVLTTFDSWVRRRLLKQIVKKWVFRGTDGVLVPGPDASAYAVALGTPADRFTSSRRLWTSNSLRKAQRKRVQIGGGREAAWASRAWSLSMSAGCGTERAWPIYSPPSTNSNESTRKMSVFSWLAMELTKQNCRRLCKPGVFVMSCSRDLR
jgi:hypothetical protein